jgi:prolipoprotein diacylglyceryltransferase
MFSLIIVAGVVTSLGWVALRAAAGQQTHAVDTAIDLAAGVLLGCLLGARSGYVLANWSYYQLHLTETIQVWLGGLSGVGAALGGALALSLLAWLSRRKLGVLADQILPLLVVLPSAAWLGCWLEGCAYGLPANDAWWGLPVIDEWGQVTPRFPLQFLGALLALGIPWLLEVWGDGQSGQAAQPGRREATVKRGRRTLAQPGIRATLCLLGLALTMLGLSFLRGDPSLLWNGLRPETWGALGLLALSGSGLGWVWRETKE